MTKLERLQRDGRRLIRLLGANGEHWCQRAYARSAIGRNVGDDSPKAVRYCPLGACRRLGINSEPIYNTFAYPITFNDSHTWPEVKAMILRAFKLGGKRKGVR